MPEENQTPGISNATEGGVQGSSFVPPDMKIPTGDLLARYLAGDNTLTEAQLRSIGKLVNGSLVDDVVKTPEGGMQVALKSGSTLKFTPADPSTGAKERIVYNSPSTEFTQESADEIIAGGILRGWTKFDLTGTEEQKEKMWLAVQKQNIETVKTFVQENGRYPVAGEITEIDTGDFQPKKNSPVIQEYMQTIASLPRPETMQQEAAKPLAPGAPVEGVAATALGKGAGSERSQSRMGKIKKALPGMAWGMAKSFAIRAVIVGGIAVCFTPPVAAVITPIVLGAMAWGRIANSAGKIYTKINDTQKQHMGEGVGKTKAFFMAMNKHKFHSAMLAGSIVLTGLAATGLMPEVTKYIEDAMEKTGTAIRGLGPTANEVMNSVQESCSEAGTAVGKTYTNVMGSVKDISKDFIPDFHDQNVSKKFIPDFHDQDVSKKFEPDFQDGEICEEVDVVPEVTEPTAEELKKAAAEIKAERAALLEVDRSTLEGKPDLLAKQGLVRQLYAVEEAQKVLNEQFAAVNTDLLDGNYSDSGEYYDPTSGMDEPDCTKAQLLDKQAEIAEQIRELEESHNEVEAALQAGGEPTVHEKALGSKGPAELSTEAQLHIKQASDFEAKINKIEGLYDKHYESYHDSCDETQAFVDDNKSLVEDIKELKELRAEVEEMSKLDHLGKEDKMFTDDLTDLADKQLEIAELEASIDAKIEATDKTTAIWKHGVEENFEGVKQSVVKRPSSVKL